MTFFSNRTGLSNHLDPKPLIVFTCNWNAYNSLERAGVQRLNYSPVIFPIKVTCLGQISPGLILKALQKGAAGVLLLGCPEGECHFEFGNRHAKEVFAETKRMAKLLGYPDEQLSLDWIAAGEGEAFVDKVRTMMTALEI
jgi:coenzyme F420-reducing hydrogenase delta subunit